MQRTSLFKVLSLTTSLLVAVFFFNLTAGQTGCKTDRDCMPSVGLLCCLRGTRFQICTMRGKCRRLQTRPTTKPFYFHDHDPRFTVSPYHWQCSTSDQCSSGYECTSGACRKGSSTSAKSLIGIFGGIAFVIVLLISVCKVCARGATQRQNCAPNNTAPQPNAAEHQNARATGDSEDPLVVLTVLIVEDRGRRCEEPRGAEWTNTDEPPFPSYLPSYSEAITGHQNLGEPEQLSDEAPPAYEDVVAGQTRLP